ncbi:MAG: hypothetical protein LBR29_06830 [Methylobacteriaceae bacterium]|jgi:hypothetical protein|nr:hypothetical protein [Methylobacteriaceae bacterium]
MASFGTQFNNRFLVPGFVFIGIVMGSISLSAKEFPDLSKGGPPIVFLTEDEAEPDRDVPAREWKSPYCTVWDDGCTQCRRKDENSEPDCEPIKESSSCVQDLVECKQRDELLVAKYCAKFTVSTTCTSNYPFQRYGGEGDIKPAVGSRGLGVGGDGYHMFQEMKGNHISLGMEVFITGVVVSYQTYTFIKLSFVKRPISLHNAILGNRKTMSGL